MPASEGKRETTKGDHNTLRDVILLLYRYILFLCRYRCRTWAGFKTVGLLATKENVKQRDKFIFLALTFYAPVITGQPIISAQSQTAPCGSPCKNSPSLGGGQRLLFNFAFSLKIYMYVYAYAQPYGLFLLFFFLYFAFEVPLSMKE